MNDEYNLQDVVGQLINIDTSLDNITTAVESFNREFDISVELHNLNYKLERIADALEIIANK
jgi:hypothetical protein